MADLILEDVKVSLGVEVDNLGFDRELLIAINSAKSGLVQLGATTLDVDILADTAWPAWPTTSLKGLVKQYLVTATKKIFDPTASEARNKLVDSVIEELSGRIAYELEEIAAGA